MSSAYDAAALLLARRPLTRSEVIDRLRDLGHDTDAIEEAIERLTVSRAIDDEALARHWMTTRIRERGRGPERAMAELHARGVSAAIAKAAWDEAAGDGTIDEQENLERAVRRRLGPPPGRADLRRLARVYNALLSEGFERERIEAALVPYGLERNRS